MLRTVFISALIGVFAMPALAQQSDGEKALQILQGILQPTQPAQATIKANRAPDFPIMACDVVQIQLLNKAMVFYCAKADQWGKSTFFVPLKSTIADLHPGFAMTMAKIALVEPDIQMQVHYTSANVPTKSSCGVTPVEKCRRAFAISVHKAN